MMAIGCVVLLNFSTEKKKKIITTMPIIILCIIIITSSAFIANSRTNEVFCGILGGYNELSLNEGDVAVFDLLSYTVPHHNSLSKLYSDYERARYPSIYGNENPFESTSFHIYQLFTKLDSARGMAYVLFPYSKYDRIGISIANGYTEYLEADRNTFYSSDEATKIFEKNIINHNVIYETKFSRLYYTNNV